MNARLLLFMCFAASLAAQASDQERAFELNEKAVAAAAAGKLDAAVDLLEQARRIDGTTAALRTNLGMLLVQRAQAHLGAGRSVVAEADARRALELIPGDAAAVAQLMELLRRRGELAAARRLVPESGSDAALDARVLSAYAQLAYDEDALDECVATATAAIAAPNAALLIDTKGLGRLLARWRNEAESERGFLREASACFVVKHQSSAERARAQEVLQAALKTATELEMALGERPQRALVIVLLPRESYLRTTGAQEWSGGLFDGRVRIPLERREHEADELRRTLKHEMVHWFVRTLAPGCPTWLNEGLAQQHEARSTQAPPLRKADIKKPLRDAPKEWNLLQDRTEVELLYRHALGFTAWLLQQHGDGAVRTLFQSLREQHSFEASFARAFGMAQDEAERTWLATLR